MVRDRLRRRRTPILGTLAFLLATSAAACDSQPARPNPNPGPTTAARPTELTFGVFGNDLEIEAYQSVVDTYNESDSGVDVTIESWPDAEALAAAVTAGQDPPDVYMLSRADLERVTEEGLNTPLTELVDERGVDMGDGYARDSVLAFSAADELQCVPYDVSPMVVFYNRELVDFERMAELDLPTPSPDDEGNEDGDEGEGGDEVPPLTYSGWGFDEFRAAAEFASRPRRQTKGIYVEPTLRGLAPFVYSGGGDLFDDEVQPSSLAFSSGETRDALTPALELLRDPALTLTEKQLSRASATEWFKRGRLGMMSGFRSQVPDLRGVPGLDFDVMPMPRADGGATVGDLSGLCIATGTANLPEAADFLVYVVSAEAVARVASAGYLVPANLQVAQSEDFLQPGSKPANAQVFNLSVQDMRLLPLIDSMRDLEAAVQEPLHQLLTMPVPDLEALTAQIDEESRTVLDPDSITGSPDPEATEGE